MRAGGKAARIADKVEHGFTVDKFVAHGTVYGTFDSYHLLGDGNENDITVLNVVFDSGSGIRHVLVEVQAVILARTGELHIADGAHVGRATRGCQCIEGGVQGADRKSTLNAHFAVYADRNGTGCRDGDSDLVRAEGEELAELVLDCSAALCKSHSLEENLGRSGRLDGAVRPDPLMDLGLRRAED